VSQGLCLVIDVLDAEEGSAQADEHLATAARVLGGGLVFARSFSGVGSPDMAVVGTRDAEDASRVAAASPLPADRRIVCGVDASVMPEAPDGSDCAPAGYLEIVLARTDPPVPCDHPTVVAVYRDYFARYLPMLGSRHLRCEALWYDADRARAIGGFIAFLAADDDEARWWAEGDPWRRLAPGYLVRLPGGLLRIQRQGRRRVGRDEIRGGGSSTSRRTRHEPRRPPCPA
jgi:hypothetical protein